MKAIKFKFDTTAANTRLSSRGYAGKTFRIQAVYYSNSSHSEHVTVFDKDGDPITHPIPGDIEPKLISVGEVSCTLPLYIVDESGGNSVLIRGVIDN